MKPNYHQCKLGWVYRRDRSLGYIKDECILTFRVSPRDKGGGGRDDVNFSRLMSLDYQREWLEQRQRKQQQNKEKLKVGQVPRYL